MNCEHDPVTLTCKACGHVARRIPTFRECRPPPSLAKRTANLAMATARHIANRGKRCSQDEIDHRFSICQSCELLVDGVCSHPRCGCGISAKRQIVSKLSWKSERCPDGRWEAIP